MRFRSVGGRLKNLGYKALRSLRAPKKRAFYRRCKINFSFRGRASSDRHSSSTLTRKTSELPALVSFLAEEVRVRARRERYGGACTTVGRRIVHSRVIIHRSPSSALPATESRGSCGRLPSPLASTREEFCSSAPRQAGYCRIPLRGLSLGLVEAHDDTFETRPRTQT